MDLAALHEPFAPLLRAALGAASPPQGGPGLDLAAGAGLKHGWLAASLLGPDDWLLSLDVERALLAAAPAPAICGDAHALPLRSAAFGRCWCVAAMAMFADPPLALHEVWRVLRPGGDLVVTLAGQRWACVRQWPPALESWAMARRPALPPADGLGDELRSLLAQAQFVDITIEAYLLNGSPAPCVLAALPLADWVALRGPLAEVLSPTLLAECERVAHAEAEPELVEILLVGRGVRG